ncbi:MAG: hypothetical protein IMY84_06220, partial [Chloroflexi bacterium]|nr:hypothetical protein [Chloroflexota bacterium]
GRCLATYEPEDPDELHFLEFLKGTQVTYKRDGRYNNGPPRWVRMRVSDDPPRIPWGTTAVSEVYDFLGYTATGKVVTSVFFDGEVGMELDYDPDNLPDNTTGIGIAVWNERTGEWVIHPQSSGRVAGIGTATADVTSFSTFVVLATTGDAVEEAPAPTPTPTPPAGPSPARFTGDGLLIQPAVEELWAPLVFLTRSGRNVTVTATIINGGEEEGTYTAELSLNGEIVGSQDVTVPGGESKLVKFRLSNVARGDYKIGIAGLSGTFSSSQQVNWWLIGSLIGLAALGLGILVARMRRKKQLQ